MAKLSGEYVPSTSQWVRDQVDTYERTGGREAATLRETGIPVVIVSMRGAKSGTVRKIALMRVEHAGRYALVASKCGAPEHPDWYHNLVANPETEIEVGSERIAVRVREAKGAERDELFERQKKAIPPFAEYEARTTRTIPVLVLERR